MINFYAGLTIYYPTRVQNLINFIEISRHGQAMTKMHRLGFFGTR